MRLWWEDFHPGWMIFTLGSQHFETLHQIIQYSQSTLIKGGLAPLQVSVTPCFSALDSCICCFLLCPACIALFLALVSLCSSQGNLSSFVLLSSCLLLNTLPHLVCLACTFLPRLPPYIVPHCTLPHCTVLHCALLICALLSRTLLHCSLPPAPVCDLIC